MRTSTPPARATVSAATASEASRGVTREPPWGPTSRSSRARRRARTRAARPEGGGASTVYDVEGGAEGSPAARRADAVGRSAPASAAARTTRRDDVRASRTTRGEARLDPPARRAKTARGPLARDVRTRSVPADAGDVDMPRVRVCGGAWRHARSTE